MKPTFAHYCEKCSFLGTLISGSNETHDFYYCAGVLGSYIARFGNEPEQYTSFPDSVLESAKHLDGMQGSIVMIAYHLRMKALRENDF